IAGIHRSEPFEDGTLLIVGYPDTCIANLNKQFGGRLLHYQGDHSLLREFARIAQEIFEDMQYLGHVNGYKIITLNDLRKPVPVLGDARTDGLNRLLDHPTYVGSFKV